MPRHTAPNHSDCYIDCPSGGYAFYIDPYGPCQTGCDTQDFVQQFSDECRARGWSMRSSGIAREVAGTELGELAEALGSVPNVSNAGSRVLEDLKEISSDRGSALIYATWSSVDVVGVLTSLRNAAGLSNRA